jgi:hypothetical protein
MELYDTPIRTLEDARRYFQAMGCSGFHMCREYPDRYEEFRRMGISEEQQRVWAQESVAKGLARLRSGELASKDLWSVHLHLSDIVRAWVLPQFLEEVYEVTCVMEPALPLRDRMLVAETIAGRQELRQREGYIFQSYDAGKPELAAQFAKLALRLVKEPVRAAGMEEARCEQVLANVAETERACGMGRG